ncbi:MAG: response regulator transcription factor [Lachnospiraceae bacterium]|nr:response regulator transcription factor [Lachnospiraceae bacterium]
MATSRILVIDDDVSILKTIEKLLIAEGYEVSLAKSGLQALKALEKGIKPILIISDIAMPDMDGYDTCNKIHSLLPDTPVIFLTSMEDTQTELTALKLGALDYLTKPFVSDIFVTKINNYVKQIITNRPADETIVATFDNKKLNDMENLLTESEFKVGKLIAQGYTNQEIAEELNYSYNYVKKLAYRIFDKLQISKRNEIRSFFI